MAFQVGEVIDGVRAEAHETSFNWFERPTYVRWLNDGLAKISRISKMYKEKEEFDLIDGQTDYEMNERFIEIDTAEIGEDKIKPRGVHNTYLYGADKRPVHYRIIQGEQNKKIFRISIEPDGNESDKLKLLEIMEHPHVKDDKADIYFPTEFRPHLIDYINYRFNLSDRESNKVQFSLQDWRKSVRDVVMQNRQMNSKGHRAIDPIAKNRLNR